MTPTRIVSSRTSYSSCFSGCKLLVECHGALALWVLVQPCGILDMEKRGHLISENLPKLSATFLEEALICVTGEGCQQSCNKLQVPEPQPDKRRGLSLVRTNAKDAAMIGLDSMQRANSTLEDFQCRSYFMFHGLDVNEPHTFFRFLPVLSFTESYIYQLDNLNEEILHLEMGDSPAKKDPGFLGVTFKNESNRTVSSDSMDAFRDPLSPLVCLLEGHVLLTERIRAELRSGTEYWALERKLCHALMGKSEVSIEDVMRAILLKSFDYRVLNLLLYQLREQPVNDLHMEFLSISEFLVEVSDDLFDYEDDVVENSFNIFRMFVRLYGPSMAPSMLAKCISEAEEKYESLLKALDPELSLKYRKRCEEATKEGGKSSGHALGTWNIPPVIVDEESYRFHVLKLQKEGT